MTPSYSDLCHSTAALTTLLPALPPPPPHPPPARSESQMARKSSGIQRLASVPLLCTQGGRFLCCAHWCTIACCLSNLGSILERSHQRQSWSWYRLLQWMVLISDVSVPEWTLLCGKQNKTHIISMPFLTFWMIEEVCQNTTNILSCSTIACNKQDISLEVSWSLLKPWFWASSKIFFN